MKLRRLLYIILNAFFHLVHSSLIVFVATAWIFAPLRPWHLALILSTLASWFIIGRWFGRGYCPLSDWHWKLKAAFGEGRPAATYIHFMMEKITGKKWNAAQIDKVIVISTLTITGLSLLLNLYPLVT